MRTIFCLVQSLQSTFIEPLKNRDTPQVERPHPILVLKRQYKAFWPSGAQTESAKK